MYNRVEVIKLTFDNTHRGFSIIGVFHVHRKPSSGMQKNRKHAALAYRLQGSSLFHFGGEELIADAQSMIYIPAGVDYSVSHKPEELIVVHLRCYNETSDRIEMLKACPNLQEPFLRLHAEWESCDPRWRHDRCMSILYSIFETAEKTKLYDSTSLPEIIRPGVELMHRDFKRHELSVTDIAAACHISEVYFRKVYKAHFGESPLEGLLALRFDYAESLLRSGYYSTKEVAALSGFSDVKYFRTAFARRVGTPPGEYRSRFGNTSK